jgi:beta-glucosidase
MTTFAASMAGLDTRTGDHDIDPNPSPMESVSTNSTPNTEFSPPCSPQQKVQQLMKDTRAAARKKLSQLTLEEKV